MIAIFQIHKPYYNAKSCINKSLEINIHRAEYGNVENELSWWQLSTLPPPLTPEEVPNRLNRGKPVNMVYLHFQNVLDKMPHKSLIVFRRSALTWMKTESQINGSLSCYKDVTSAVPQRSVLSLQLFTITCRRQSVRYPNLLISWK